MTWKVRVLVLLFPLTVAATAATAPGGERLPEALREHVERRVGRGSPPGLVIGILDPQGVMFHSRGVMWEGGPPVAEDTIFEIGSVTKVFTAALLADMALRGEVELDEPVARLLGPGFGAPAGGHRQMTLSDLAMHRSGLPRLPDDFVPADLDNPYADYGAGRLGRYLAEHPLQRGPGEGYEYSNLGYGLLGYALAARAGVGYELLVVERLVRPLGLRDTGISLDEKRLSRLARGHAGGAAVPGWDFDALAGAGALRSTARDLARFLAAQMGLVEGAPAALAATRGELFETGVEDLAVTLGWHVWRRADRTLYWHGGGTGGYRSFVGFDPERRLGVVVLGNGVDEIDPIGQHLLDSAEPLPAARTMVAVAATDLEPLVGTYELLPGMLFHVTREDDQLYAQLTGQPRFPVYPESRRAFYYEAVDARLVFESGEDGRIERLVLHQDGEHPARRLEGYSVVERVEVAVEPEVLARYVGRYELAPGTVFDVALADDRLAVKLGDQPRWPVRAESQTRFFYDIVDAQLTFLVGDDGVVTALVLHQGGIEQTARRRE